MPVAAPDERDERVVWVFAQGRCGRGPELGGGGVRRFERVGGLEQFGPGLGRERGGGGLERGEGRVGRDVRLDGGGGEGAVEEAVEAAGVVYGLREPERRGGGVGCGVCGGGVG